MLGAATKRSATEEGKQTMSDRPAGATSTEPVTKAGRGAKTIEARDVNLFYGDFHAVEDVTMTIAPNKVTALIGSSGCGKTTFLRSLNRMHELTPGARVEGHVSLDGEDIYGKGVDPVEVRRLIGMVFQQPNPFPTMSIYDNVAAGLNLNARRVPKAAEGRGGRALAARRAPLGGGQGPARQARAPASPAASSSGSASPGRSRSSPRCC